MRGQICLHYIQCPNTHHAIRSHSLTDLWKHYSKTLLEFVVVFCFSFRGEAAAYHVLAVTHNGLLFVYELSMKGAASESYCVNLLNPVFQHPKESIPSGGESGWIPVPV